MEIKRKPKPKNVLVYMVVFLCMLGAAFFFFFSSQGTWRLFWTPEQPAADNGAEQGLSQAEREFIDKNQTQIEALRQTVAKLEETLPDLGVTSREFNEGLLPLIELLQGLGAELRPEDWPQFQTQFAYQYDKLNTLRQERTNLPTQVAESEDKVMQVLQELNQIIQRMNK